MSTAGTLVLLRHGESTANAAQRFTGLLDVELTYLGARQARVAAGFMERSGAHPDVVMTSPLWRGRRTAALAITIAARDARRSLSAPSGRRTLSFNLREPRQAGLARAFLPVALFELGNVATTLLILRATDLLHVDGRSVAGATSLAIVLYAAHDGAATLAALGGGRVIDRTIPRLVFGCGVAVYVLAYAVFAWEQHSWPVLLGAFVLAGAGIGFAETAESTMVAVMLPDRLRGNGFGVLGLVQSIGDVGASVVVGLVWAAISPTLAFGYAATWMVAYLIALIIASRTNRRTLQR